MNRLGIRLGLEQVQARDRLNLSSAPEFTTQFGTVPVVPEQKLVSPTATVPREISAPEMPDEHDLPILSSTLAGLPFSLPRASNLPSNSRIRSVYTTRNPSTSEGETRPESICSGFAGR